MSSKMLIDASHPEETRVAVMKGNRVDEFDFESENKKQLRGNIYLAKVTRVEPSLQAAFIDYGGNRHGFLAFSEIHPDYYQIPVADRQALLREEAEVVRQEDDEPAEKPTKRTRKRRSADADDEAEEVQGKSRRRSRRRRSKKDEADEGVDAAPDDVTDTDHSGTDEADAEATDAQVDGSDDDAPRTMSAANGNESVSEPAEASDDEPQEKPKRRRTSRPRAKKAEAAPAAETAEDGASTAVEAVETAEAVADEPAEEAPKPKRRRRSSKTTDEAAEAPAEAVAKAAEAASAKDEPAEDKLAEDEKPKRRRRSRKAEPEAEAADAQATDEVAAKTEAEPAETDDSAEDIQAEEKPKRARRTRARKKPAEAEPADEPAEEIAASDDDTDDDVEDVGTDDALEEVPTRRVSRRNYKIQEVIKRRQIMLVQVVKEERGNKGAALTTYLSLAGRYSVLMPNTARGGGISRKITSAGDRKKLKEIASSLEVTPGMGVILRTAGASHTEAEINRDFEYLLRLWENVRTLTLKSTAPCLVYEEGSLIKRSIRDLYSNDTSEITVAGREGYEEARDFMSMLEPAQARNVKYYEGSTPLFAKMGVESQLDHMLQPQVTLKSGGYLVINQTEALVAIDVNSGKSTRQHSIEETATQTNLEAADEVARQLRLRDLAGLIVIDFIDMDDRRNNRAVEKRMKDALKNDRARIQVGRISHFGLLEMSRQRMRASVLESATEICPHCAGLGYVRSPSSVSIHVLRSIEEYLIRSARNNVTVKTRLRTALYLLNNKRTSIDDLEARFGVTITIEADEAVGQSHLAIERGDVAQPRMRADHVQVDSIQPENAAEEEPEAEVPPVVQVPAEPPEVETASEDELPRKRRRGRRGGKRASEREDNGAEEAAEESMEADAGASDEPPVAAQADEEAKPKRRRRRGKSEEATSEPSAAPVDAADTAHEAEAATPGGDTPDEPPRANRRPTSRPRRKSAEEAVTETAVHATSDAVVADEPEAEPAELVGEAAEPASSDEPPRPTRRRTSRRKANGSSDGETNGSTDGVAAQGDAPGETADRSEAAVESEGDGEKKNWLQRTFFS